MTTMTAPLVLEIDRDTWSDSVDRVTPWLATTATLQGAFRGMVEDTLTDLTNATIRGYLEGIRDSAREHERQVADLYRAFGREPAGGGVLHAVASGVVSKTRQLAGRVEGVAAGAHGAAWHKMRELLLTNLDAISGFAVTEQLALSLGLPAAVKILVPILKQKTEQQLQIKESFLEMAPLAILYRQDA